MIVRDRTKNKNATATVKPCVNIIKREWMSEVNITNPSITARAKIAIEISANLLPRADPQG